MHVDDRLATVLTIAVDGDVARRIQYRQLLDLLGTSGAEARGDLHDEAHMRLAELARMIPADERARAIATSSVRLRNPRLIAELASGNPAVALAAVRAARLDEGQWLDLIPAIPLAARGLLRARRDLGPAVDARLAQLGIAERALPPAAATAAATAAQGAADAAQPEPHAATPQRPRLAVAQPVPLAEQTGTSPMPGEGIAAIVRRIETFRRNREQGESPSPGDSPRLPLREFDSLPARLPAFGFGTDAAGRIGWADSGAAPMVCGLLLPRVSGDHPAVAIAEAELARAFRRRLPMRGLAVSLEGATAIAGDWVIDASPDFDGNGRFTGYVGRFRRPAPPIETVRNGEVDRIRQVLHELRTPVNAIQGFAEVIQQQLFGATPHEYRALAASIAADAARMLAGFEELDRFARLDAGALQPDAGQADLAMVVAGVVHQLEAFTNARSSGFSLSAPAGELPVGLETGEAERLVWRLLATLAGAARPGEVLALSLNLNGNAVQLAAQLPESLAALDDIFAPSVPPAGQAVNAGVFGNGFTLRLAAAEARAAGGSLDRNGAELVLCLSLLEQQSETGSLQNAGNAVASAAE